MHSVFFVTGSATDHVTRALDELARTGFKLDNLRVSGSHTLHQVRIGFSGTATVAAESYAARLARMPGVESLRLEAVGPAAAEMARSVAATLLSDA